MMPMAWSGGIVRYMVEIVEVVVVVVITTFWNTRAWWEVPFAGNFG